MKHESWGLDIRHPSHLIKLHVGGESIVVQVYCIGDRFYDNSTSENHGRLESMVQGLCRVFELTGSKHCK